MLLQVTTKSMKKGSQRYVLTFSHYSWEFNFTLASVKCQCKPTLFLEKNQNKLLCYGDHEYTLTKLMKNKVSCYTNDLA